MEVLQHYFGNQEWLVQARDGMESFLQRCIEQLSATPAPTNGSAISDGADYKAYARTAAEIKETMAAEEGAVSHARNVPRYRQRPDEVEIPEQELADPMRHEAPRSATPPASKGWAL